MYIPAKTRKFTPQEIFLLKNGIYAAAKGLTTEDWKNHFFAMDKAHRVRAISKFGLLKLLTCIDQGWLSFDDFMKTVRRAGIKPSVLSDDELQRIVEIVDSDGRFDRILNAAVVCIWQY